jgi:GTP cyclohydrolase FolE2
LQKVSKKYLNQPPETLICVKQINYESIHQHNAVAEVKISLKKLMEQLNGLEANEDNQ